MSIIRQTIEINTPAILTTNGIALNETSERKSWNIQNIGTNPLFVRLGAEATDEIFHFILKGGSSQDDGTGGSVGEWLGVIFTGDIYIYGVSPRLVVKEN